MFKPLLDWISTMPRKAVSTDKPVVRKKAAPSAPAPKRHKKAAPASSPEVHREVTHADIALLAYTYWEQRGYQDGSPEADWLRAEQELRASGR